jgi:parallel beta helix pectate lyase-like protein
MIANRHAPVEDHVQAPRPRRRPPRLRDLLATGIIALAFVGLLVPLTGSSAATPPSAQTMITSWSATQQVAKIQDGNASIAYSGRWIRATYRSYLGGSVRSTTQRNAKATMTFTGTGISWVGPIGPTRGKARVFIDGILVKTVDMHATRFLSARVVFSRTFTVAKPRTIKVVALGTAGHPTVAIDAFVVLNKPVDAAKNPHATPTPTPVPAATPKATTAPAPTPAPTAPPAAPAGCTTSAPAPNGASQTSALQSWINAAPNGSTLCFQAGATYRSEGTIGIENRKNLTIDGRGATIYTASISTANRSNWRLVSSSGIVIKNLTIKGANSAPGVFDPNHQQDHGIRIDGGSGVEVANVHLINQQGDGIYMGDRDGLVPWVDGVHVHDTTISGAGRNCIGMVAARNVTVESVAISGCGYHAFDIEPNTGSEGADHVIWRNSTVRTPVFDYVFASNGYAGTMTNIRVDSVKVYGKEFRTTVQAKPGYRFANIAIVNNSSDTAVKGPVMWFKSIDGLTVTGNSQPLTSGSLASVLDSTSVNVSGN